MRLILQNIKELVQVDPKSRLWVAGKSMAEVQTLKNAFLIIQDEQIKDFGLMENLSQVEYGTDDVMMEIDCSGKMVFPSYCDSHTHLVFAATREHEFVDRLKGLTYEEMAGLVLGYNPWDMGMQMHQTNVEPLLDKMGIQYDPELKYANKKGKMIGKPMMVGCGC